VLAFTATGVVKVTDCQPVVVSLVKVADARRVPLVVQSEPVWIPVLPVPLKNRTPVTFPSLLDVNRIPNSTAEASVLAGVAGVSLASTVDVEAATCSTGRLVHEVSVAPAAATATAKGRVPTAARARRVKEGMRGRTPEIVSLALRRAGSERGRSDG
jgi:hypothetical protein